MRLVNFRLMDAGSLANDITSSSFNVETDGLYAIQCIVNGPSAVGTATVQASNDNQNFVPVTGGTLAISGSGSVMFNVRYVGYKWVRIAYSKTSGTGAMTIVAEGKGF